MKSAIEKFLAYLRSVRNASAHTLRNYASDLEQFHTYLTPPDSPPAKLADIDHRVIREYLGYLHDQKLQKSSMARNAPRGLRGRRKIPRRCCWSAIARFWSCSMLRGCA